MGVMLTSRFQGWRNPRKTLGKPALFGYADHPTLHEIALQEVRVHHSADCPQLPANLRPQGDVPSLTANEKSPASLLGSVPSRWFAWPDGKAGRRVAAWRGTLRLPALGLRNLYPPRPG